MLLNIEKMKTNMKLDLTKIFNLQRELDKHIHGQHNVSYDTIQPELKLALLVELAETANEIRSFKFWSFKGPSDKPIILEEYVDAIHFVTALGISHKCKEVFDLEQLPKFTTKREVTEAFNILFASVNTIKDGISTYAWYKSYLEFGLRLGFSPDDIVKAYEAKCIINHQRQDNKY